MSRPLRLDLPDAIHHVTARGNERGPIYRDDIDRACWNDQLARITDRCGWLILAFCQMTNHFHLLVETPNPNLSRGMRHLNGVYAQRFNRRHRRVGHLFQARFHATLIEHDEHLLHVAAYIPHNPVKAGLCAAAGDWPWSSYRAAVGLDPPGHLACDRLLSHFAPTPEAARARYQDHVAESPDSTLDAELATDVIYGSDSFKHRQTQHLQPIPEIPRRHRNPTRVPLEHLIDTRTDGAISHAYTHHGYTMREIAAHLGVHYATVSRRIHRHETVRECKT